MITNRRQ